jgi:thioredoxin-like negative regulator of GroEL
LEAIAKERQDVHLRIIDINAWSSEVAQQHSIRRLPTIWLYQDGNLVTKDTNEAVSKLRQKR